jgi:site-specific recombinase XerD
MKKTMLAKVQDYLKQRRALGYQLRGQGYQLLSFARYADGRGHQGALTCSLALRWACLPRAATRLYWAHRLAIVRTFAHHLQLSEPHTQVPARHLLGPTHRRRCPHLYTPAQVRALFCRAGQLRGQFRRHTWQTLLGLLACCGLRISEALRLKPEDMDWKQGVLLIRESKCGKTRLVPLHRTALKPLRAYAQRRQERFAWAQHFFVSQRGQGMTRNTAEQVFQQLRQGLAFTGYPPRLQDLRHTLACRVLQRAQAQGKDAGNHVLILSRFLGHSHVEDTYWYLSALPQLLAKAAARFVLRVDESA